MVLDPARRRALRTARPGRLLVAALVLAGLAGGCLGSSPPPWSARETPDWVRNGGRSPRFPDAHYLTGFGIAQGSQALEAAKRQAAADLAGRIEIHIENELSDVSEDRDGHSTYHVAAVTRSTINLKLGGLGYEVHAEDGSVFALALLERTRAARDRRQQRDLALALVRDCLADGEERERGGRIGRAVVVYEGCRTPLSEALRHAAVVGSLVEIGERDREALRELLRASRRLGDRLAAAVRQPRSLGAAAESLVLLLGRQGLAADDRVQEGAFTYGTADFGSSFGVRLSRELEQALRRVPLEAAGAERAVTLRGVFLEDGEDVLVDATAEHGEDARLLASAGVKLPRAAVPEDLEVKPADYEAVLEVQRLLSDGGVVTGDLRLELWTDHGRKGVVLTEGDEYQLYLRVNRPAWVTLSYVLQSGEQVLIDDGFYIGAEDVGRAVRYPHRFHVVPPFGVEHLYGTAYGERPPPRATRVTWIGGERYEVLVGGPEAIERTRGLRVARDAEVAESFVAVTTTPRSAAR